MALGCKQLPSSSSLPLRLFGYSYHMDDMLCLVYILYYPSLIQKYVIDIMVNDELLWLKVIKIIKMGSHIRSNIGSNMHEKKAVKFKHEH